MITVSILINGQPILTRTAVNTLVADKKTGKTKYKLDTGEIILHKYKAGVIVLAIKMLKTIKGVK